MAEANETKVEPAESTTVPVTKKKRTEKKAKKAAQPMIVGRVSVVTVGKTETGFSLKLKKGKTETFWLESWTDLNRPSAIMLLSTAASTRAKVQVQLSAETDGKRIVEQVSLHGH
jgi:Ribonuclease G/E